jgi:hypothetical protein
VVNGCVRGNEGRYFVVQNGAFLVANGYALFL